MDIISRLPTGLLTKLPQEFIDHFQRTVTADTSANQMHDIIFSGISADEAKAKGYSRTDLYNLVLAIRKSTVLAPQDTSQEPGAAPADILQVSMGKEGTVTSPEKVTSGTPESPSSESSEENEDETGIDLEFASIGIPELQGMILKKESFKALRRHILANTRPRKAMSAAKMHLPSRLAHTDKTLESCVDQTYLAIASLEEGQVGIAKLLLNNMAANLEVERRAAIAAALGVEDEATDISRDGRTDLFSFEERERLPSFREQSKSRKKQSKKTKTKSNTDRSFRPSTDTKNGKKTGGSDRKGSHQKTGD